MWMILNGLFVKIIIQLKIPYLFIPFYALLIYTSFTDIPGSEATEGKVDMEILTLLMWIEKKETF